MTTRYNAGTVRPYRFWGGAGRRPAAAASISIEKIAQSAGVKNPASSNMPHKAVSMPRMELKDARVVSL
jgi:hypothetical protein